MIKTSLVSVVIPAYNAEKTIADCLDSVNDQTYPDIEIIVINDGSADQTLKLLEEYQRFSLRPLRIYTQKNAGPSVARNCGISLAKGEYIAFLDADDRWVKDKIENQLKVFESDRSIGLVAGLISVGKAVRNKEKFQVKQISLNQLIFKNCFVTSTVVCKKSSLNSIGFNNHQKYAEDYRVWLEVAASGVKCVVLQQYVTIMNDKPLYGFAGLSSNLWAMEKGEIANFTCLKNKGKLPVAFYWGACFFSFSKFIRRFLITVLRKQLR